MNSNNASPNNTKNAKKNGQRFEQYSTSNCTTEGKTDKINFNFSTDGGMTFSTHQPKTDCHQKQPILSKMEGIITCFNRFQEAIEDVKTEALLNNYCYDHSSLTEFMARGEITAPKHETGTFANVELKKLWICQSIYREDDDWDIYQPINETKSKPMEDPPLEPRFGLLKSRIEGKIRLSKSCVSNAIDSNACQQSSKLSPPAQISLSSTLHQNGSQLIDFKAERMLKRVKAYFANNPIRIAENISLLEFKERLLSAPYFSREFAMEHGLLLENAKTDEDNLLQQFNRESKSSEEPGFMKDLIKEYKKACLKNSQLRKRIMLIRNRLSKIRGDSTSADSSS